MSPRSFLFAVAAVAMAFGVTAVTVSPAIAAESGFVLRSGGLDLGPAPTRVGTAHAGN